MTVADAFHREHAVVELAIRDIKEGAGLDHIPSGHYHANAAAGGAVIGAISGHVSGGMSRSDLKVLGERLDTGQSALIVAAATNLEDKVAAALTRADEVITKPLQVDDNTLTEDVSAATDDEG